MSVPSERCNVLPQICQPGKSGEPPRGLALRSHCAMGCANALSQHCASRPEVAPPIRAQKKPAARVLRRPACLAGGTEDGRASTCRAIKVPIESMSELPLPVVLAVVRCATSFAPEAQTVSAKAAAPNCSPDRNGRESALKAERGGRDANVVPREARS